MYLDGVPHRRHGELLRNGVADSMGCFGSLIIQLADSDMLLLLVFGDGCGVFEPCQPDVRVGHYNFSLLLTKL